jgi:SAM-dependent methyltransferase
LPSWVLKAAVQKLLSPLPGAHRLNRALQAHVTRTLDLTSDRVAAQMGRCARHLEAYVSTRGRTPGRVLEVGTGWHPLLPLGFHLCGCDEIRTVDRVALLTSWTIREALDAVAAGIAAGTLAAALPRLVPGRAARLTQGLRDLRSASGTEALERLGIRYQVGEASILPAGSADLVVTNSVLEHLEERELRALLRELRRIVATGGVASHFVDLGDHYATFDRRIDVYNFLKFRTGTWKLVNSRLHFQSRLRIGDYRRLLAETGWTLLEETSQRGTAADLARIRLAAEFTRHSLDDLLVYRSWIRAMPAGEASSGPLSDAAGRGGSGAGGGHPL